MLKPLIDRLNSHWSSFIKQSWVKKATNVRDKEIKNFEFFLFNLMEYGKRTPFSKEISNLVNQRIEELGLDPRYLKRMALEVKSDYLYQWEFKSPRDLGAVFKMNFTYTITSGVLIWNFVNFISSAVPDNNEDKENEEKLLKQKGLRTSFSDSSYGRDP